MIILFISILFSSDIALVSQISNYRFYQSNCKFYQRVFSKNRIFAKGMACCKCRNHVLLVRDTFFQALELQTVVKTIRPRISANRIIGLFRKPLLSI